MFTYIYLYINAYICIFCSYIHIHTQKCVLFLGDVEIYQASRKGAGRRTVIQYPELPRFSRLLSVPPAHSRLSEDATSRSARAQHPRRGDPPPSPPDPVQSERRGRDARGRDAGLPGDSSVPVSRPLPSLRVLPPPPGTGLRSCPRCRRG